MSLFGGGGGPTPLGMFAQPQQGGGGGGFLDMFEQRMNNPLVAAALGAGGAMSGSEGNLANAISAGLGGGAGSALGALRAQRQKTKDDEREEMMRKLMERYAGVANQPRIGGMFDAQRQAPPVQLAGQQMDQIPGLF